MYAKNLPFSYHSIKNVGPDSLTVFFCYGCGATLLMFSAKVKSFRLIYKLFEHPEQDSLDILSCDWDTFAVFAIIQEM